ncbi:NfeD family protein [Roseomonas hellenica]|uniref:NfeD family protein n=2 Tax=Plastoroseomonas hellenica TaxID=2687306 RepID=A0ABS5F232_9PROT|nr:NfeD family protein [Plastoroseomonas hellenica]MBR0644678.1 NfeD family protein [Plastoroseomonas hellenica]MBR0666595.1 NfeD family protein [Plastoroseomonas hellenica]
MDPGLIWILVGLVLLGGELVLPGIFLLWIGLAAIGTGLLMLVAVPSFGVTVLVFIVLLAAGIAAGLRLRPRRRGHATMNTPVSGLVGRAGTVLTATPEGLRVRVGDSDWPARLPHDAAAPAPGAAVRVEAVDGMTLIVRPAG